MAVVVENICLLHYTGYHFRKKNFHSSYVLFLSSLPRLLSFRLSFLHVIVFFVLPTHLSSLSTLSLYTLACFAVIYLSFASGNLVTHHSQPSPLSYNSLFVSPSFPLPFITRPGHLGSRHPSLWLAPLPSCTPSYFTFPHLP